MLRVTTSVNAGAAKRYYTEGLERGDYYAAEGNEPGRWMGKGAKLLGLSGEVTKVAFGRLCKNEDPTSGEQLTPRMKADRRVGYDFTFDVPKGASLAFALLGDTRVKDALREAVEATMEKVEAEMKTRVRVKGQQTDRTTGNIVAAAFLHTTTRPVNGVPDPQVHVHVFVFNTTFDHEEKRWKAGQFGDLKKDAPYFEAFFQSCFAKKLASLGYEVQRSGKFFDLAGLSDSLLKKFSNRTTQIEATAKRLGITDPEEKAGLGAKTRRRKEEAKPMDQVRAAWNERLTPEDRKELDSLSSGQRGPRRDAKAVLEQALQSILERNSVVEERALFEQSLRLGVGEVTEDELKNELLSREDIIRRTVADEVLVTTKAVLQEERDVVTYVRQGFGACKPIATELPEALAKEASADQKQALEKLLRSEDQVTLLRGVAGTGKTWVMSQAANCMRERGIPVVAIAPTGRAAHEVLPESGFPKAETVAAFLHREDLQEKAKGGVVWVDEAGLLGMKDMGQVYQAASRVGARVYLSGDYRQHASVARGDTLRVLEDIAGLPPATLADIRRQTGSYREAVKSLSEGRIIEGFKKLDKLGSIQEVPDELERYTKVAKVFVEAEKAGRSTIAICPTHAEGKVATEAIREERRREGLLDASSKEVPCLRSLNLTEAERRDFRSFRAGQVVEFHQHAPGFKSGSRLHVASIDTAQGGVLLTDGRALPLNAAGKFTVYTQGTLEVAAGDRVRITKNGRTADGASKVTNGSCHTVDRVTASGEVVLKGERVLSADHGHLDHGYCVTSLTSQGGSANLALVVETSASGLAASNAQFYVSVSRGKSELQVFTDDKQKLLEKVQRSAERTSATELVVRPLRGADEWYREQLALDERRRARNIEREREHD